MSKTDLQMSRLFGSLGADDAELHRSAAAAAGEAEQRWPLFQAVPVAPAAPLPPLPEQARQHRLGADAAPASPRKAALVVPGLGNKLADSLAKLAAAPTRRARNAAPAPEPARIVPDAVAAPAPFPGAQRQAEARAPLQTGAAEGLHGEAPRKPLSLFGKKTRPAAAAQVDAAAAQDSLASVFSRLEGTAPSTQAPGNPRSSIFAKARRR